MAMDPRKRAWIENALRRASYKWVGRWEAEKASKLEGRNQYKCVMCPEGTIHGKKDTQMDHIIPVVDPVKGKGTLDEWADRLLVYKEGWQRLCIMHHAEKTAFENVIRKEVKKKAPKKRSPKKK